METLSLKSSEWKADTYVKNSWSRKLFLSQITRVPLLAVEWWKQIWLCVFALEGLVAWYLWNRLTKPCPELTILTCCQVSDCHVTMLSMTMVVWAKHHCSVSSKTVFTAIFAMHQKTWFPHSFEWNYYIGTAGVAPWRVLSKKGGSFTENFDTMLLNICKYLIPSKIWLTVSCHMRRVITYFFFYHILTF